MKYLLLLVFASILFYGCSKDDEVTKPAVNDELITGKWVTQVWMESGGERDSLEVSLNISGKEGAFTGTGKVKFSHWTQSSSTRYNFEDDAAGSYSENEILVTVLSSISGNSYTFTGNRVNSSGSVSYKGKVVLNVSSTPKVFDDITLFKSNE